MNVVPTVDWICAQFELHLLAQLPVEGAERLVQQQHARVARQRTGDRDALLHPARQLGRPMLRGVREADELEHLGCAAATRGARDTLHPQRVGDVVLDGHVREERVALEHRVGVSLERGRSMTSTPEMLTLPSSGLTNPPTTRIVVVLPLPLGPRIARNSPAATSSERFDTASKLP